MKTQFIFKWKNYLEQYNQSNLHCGLLPARTQCTGAGEN